jgi:hypothetical protein
MDADLSSCPLSRTLRVFKAGNATIEQLGMLLASGIMISRTSMWDPLLPRPRSSPPPNILSEQARVGCKAAVAEASMLVGSCHDTTSSRLSACGIGARVSSSGTFFLPSLKRECAQKPQYVGSQLLGGMLNSMSIVCFR